MEDTGTGGGPAQELNGRVINPIALERRLSMIEGGLARLEQKIDQWTQSHDAWGISQNMQNLTRLDALQEAIAELRTANAVCSNRWDNHSHEHDRHAKEHEVIVKKERTMDVLVGVFSSAVGVLASIFGS